MTLMASRLCRLHHMSSPFLPFSGRLAGFLVPSWKPRFLNSSLAMRFLNRVSSGHRAEIQTQTQTRI